MTYDDGLTLVRNGQFRFFVDKFIASADAEDTPPQLKALVAYVSAVMDDAKTAVSLLRFNENKLSPGVRSQIETARGIISWRSGAHDTAWHHLQAGVRLAREASDTERVAWAYLHLWRFAIEVQASDAVEALLGEVRDAVVRAGIPAATAYLHVCVAAFEGQRGNLDEVSRHCDIAESLLRVEPNAWVLSGSLVNRSCVACLRYDFYTALKHVDRILALTSVHSAQTHRHSAENMSGYVHFLSGEFDKAERTLSGVLSKQHLADGTKTDTADLLARVYLAQGNLERCEQTLSLIGSNEQADTSTYGKRWACLTRAKLLLKQRHFDAAVRYLRSLETRASARGDAPFWAAIHLLGAETFARLGNERDSSSSLLVADLAGARSRTELKGHFYHSAGVILARSDHLLAAKLRERAGRIWTSHGVVALRAEIDDGTAQPTSTSVEVFKPSPEERVRIAISSIAAAVDQADNPRLLGAELLSLLETTAFATNAAITEAVDGSRDGLDRSGRKLTLRLGNGSRPGKSVVLSCDVPASPADALTVADIFHIGRTVLELEKARQEERSRAALWPADPIEMQAGVLFIAEEMQTVLDTARRVAAANIPVLITGETGTGKEVLARLIHNYSPRATKTFLPFNCTATPRDMLDSQLFGHRRGAFTGAMENFSGVIRAASGGTLFLDEIGESTLDIQPKLLRFLESGEVHPIGETHPQRVDVRVIAATNADVDMLVSQGRFREDLFYRLNIVRLHMPPLRERRVEIPAFANHFLEKSAKEMNKGELRLAEETMEYLVLYRWPGNVRQIANEMRRLAALAERGAVLMPEHLSADIAASRKTLPASERTLDAASEIVVRIDQPFGAAVQHLERAMVQAALASTNSVDEAAKLLGVSRKGLYLKRLRYGMEIDRPGTR